MYMLLYCSMPPDPPRKVFVVMETGHYLSYSLPYGSYSSSLTCIYHLCLYMYMYKRFLSKSTTYLIMLNIISTSDWYVNFIDLVYHLKDYLYKGTFFLFTYLNTSRTEHQGDPKVCRPPKDRSTPYPYEPNGPTQKQPKNKNKLTCK